VFLGSNALLWWLGEAVAQPPETWAITVPLSMKATPNSSTMYSVIPVSRVSGFETALDVQVEAGVRKNDRPHTPRPQPQPGGGKGRQNHYYSILTSRADQEGSNWRAASRER